MKRTPIKRTAFKRKEGPTTSSLEHPQAKPVTAHTCAHCGKPFLPFQSTQKVCATMRCAKGYAAAKRKADEKVERDSFKARKEKLKSISEWEDECRRIVQKIARIRDKDDGCISCHLPASWMGQWHGSHFRSHGACSSLQFHLWNIHKACSSCNHRKGGNIIEYRPKLIAKIGQERHDWIMAQPKVGWKHGPAYIEYMKRFKKVMGKRLRRLEKRQAA